MLRIQYGNMYTCKDLNITDKRNLFLVVLVTRIWYWVIERDPSLLMVVDFSKTISSVMYFSADCWLRLQSDSVYACYFHIIAWFTSSLFQKPDSLFSPKPFQFIPSNSLSMFLNNKSHSHARNAPFLFTFPKQKSN